VLGVARQWRGWPHRVDSDGKDRSRRPDVTAWPCIVTEKAFEGVAGPLRELSALAVRGSVAQCRGADTGLIAQRHRVAGMASPRESVEQHRDAIPGRARVVACVLRCQSIKCPYTGARARTTCVQVPSSEAVLAEGALSPRARRTSPEGVLRPRARRTPPKGTRSPRARRTLLEVARSPRARLEGRSVVPP
jgi:hypothetical protein